MERWKTEEARTCAGLALFRGGGCRCVVYVTESAGRREGQRGGRGVEVGGRVGRRARTRQNKGGGGYNLFGCVWRRWRCRIRAVRR